MFLLSTCKYSSSVTLECSYQITAARSYVCINTNLIINENNVEVTEIAGVHLEGKSDHSVKAIYLLSSSMRRLPQNVYGLLPMVKRFIVQGMDVQGKHLDREALNKGDFEGAQSLNLISISGVNLHYVRPNVFQGADNLDFLSLEACGILNIDEKALEDLGKLRSLSLNYNLIKVLHKNTFKNLKRLKVLMVAGNFIERIHESHFSNLQSIRKISFISNQLKVIDKDLTRSLPKLEKLYLGRNICVDVTFGANRTSIEQFEDVVENCTDENSAENKLMKLSMENNRLREKASSLTKEIALLESDNKSLRSDLNSISRIENECAPSAREETEGGEADTKSVILKQNELEFINCMREKNLI